MADLQGLLHSLQQLAVTIPGLLIELTVLFTTCLVPFLRSVSTVLSALRQVSRDGRMLMQERQEWRQLLKSLSSNCKPGR